MIKKEDGVYVLNVDGKISYLLEDDIIKLFNDIPEYAADIMQKRANLPKVIEDKDDEIIEYCFRKIETPRKKRAERLNDGEE